MVAEVLRVVDDAREEVFLVGLEGERFDLVLPLDQVFELGARGVARDLDAPVTDGTGVFLVLLDFAPRDLEAFAVVPTLVSNRQPSRGKLELTTHGTTRTQSSSPPPPCGKYKTPP